MALKINSRRSRSANIGIAGELGFLFKESRSRKGAAFLCNGLAMSYADDSAKKVIYLAIQDASKRWTMPIRNWKLALNRFMIEFEDRLVDYV
jgi:hypothetical protein